MNNKTQIYLNDFDMFDLLFSNFLRGTNYRPLSEQKPDYPFDAYTTPTALHIDIPILDGILEDITVSTENNEIRVTYHRSNKLDENVNYIRRSIKRSDFSDGWRISPIYDLSRLECTYKNGLLKLTVPRSEASFPKEIKVIDLNNDQKQLN